MDHEDKVPDRRTYDQNISRLDSKVEVMRNDVNRIEKVLEDLAGSVSKLSNIVNRAIWVLLGGAAVVLFLTNGQFTQTVKVGSAIAEAQQHGSR